MGVITIQCPRTGRRVSTGIAIEREYFDRMRETQFTLQCWLCGGEHVWSKRWATLSSDNRRSDKALELSAGLEWA